CAEVPCSINYGASVTPCNSSDARQIAKALIRDRLLVAEKRKAFAEGVARAKVAGRMSPPTAAPELRPDLHPAQ
ncbi:MAG: hypothetical protein ACJAVJ_001874, partial [Planctomycetota bacterium]